MNFIFFYWNKHNNDLILLSDMATGNSLEELMTKNFLDFCITMNALDILVSFNTGYYEYNF